MATGHAANSLISGKYADFKKEEYSIMLTRIQSINRILTEKCKSLSPKPLESDFSFNFVFHGMASYLKKIEEYDKKNRKDELKKWWMNQKASEMAKDCLPAIFDRIDEVCAIIASQKRSELTRSKFEKYLRFELLESALKSSFRRPRASAANVFPFCSLNTSFQYARSRLRKKLENTYFNESDLKNMSSNDKKKKDEWIKMIKKQKAVYKREYEADKLKKQQKKHKNKQKRRKKLKKKQKQFDNTTLSLSLSSHSSNITISDSLCISTGNDSDSPPNMDTIHDGIEVNVNNQTHSIPPALNVLNMPKILKKGPSGYCSQCTHYAIQLSQLTKDAHALRMSLGETQMTLNSVMQESSHWKKKYVAIKQQFEAFQIENNINYKQQYFQLKAHIGALLNNSNHTSSNHNRPKSKSISFRSSEFSDKMSISNNSSFNKFNFQTTDTVISAFNPMPILSLPQQQPAPVGHGNMSQIVADHLKHDSNSTEKMLQKVREQNDGNLTSELMKDSPSQSFLGADAQSLLIPIEDNENESTRSHHIRSHDHVQSISLNDLNGGDDDVLNLQQRRSKMNIPPLFLTNNGNESMLVAPSQTPKLTNNVSNNGSVVIYNSMNNNNVYHIQQSQPPFGGGNMSHPHPPPPPPPTNQFVARYNDPNHQTINM